MALAVLHTSYFRETYPDEWAAVHDVFPPTHRGDSLDNLPSGSVVLPRYRAVPFGEELEREVLRRGSRLINTYAQHCAIDDIFMWSELLGDMTAPTYRVEDMEGVPEGKFVVKGQVSSLKNHGPAYVFADNKEQALAIVKVLQANPLTANQIPVIRPVQDYLRLGTSAQGLPVLNEHRVFVYRGLVLTTEFYWHGNGTLDIPVPELDEGFIMSVSDALNLVEHIADFMVLDVAQYTDGHWGVVEINDACHSGFSTPTTAREVYSGLVTQDLSRRNNG